MKKKSLAILCCIALVMMGSSSHAQDIGDVVISDNAVVIPAGCEVSKILTNRLASAVGDELIPITIRLVDNIDLDEVELLAMEQVGVTAIQLEESDSMTQQEMYHRVSAKRTAILGSYYQELNQNFLSSVGLDNNDYESVSRLLPYIRGIRLTKSQIIALAHHPQVCYMDLYEDVTGEDYASIGDTRQIIGGNIAINSGYTGSGIRVGLVESGHLNIDINVYKNGRLVASSTATGGPSTVQASTNYEIIQLEPSVLQTYGTGEYEVRLTPNGSFSGMSLNYVGVAYGSKM